MLVNFKTKNYKSFKDGFEFSLQPTRIRDLPNSLLKFKKEKILSSGVIYGPNAAGKTTVIEALSRIQEIILNGHINNTTETRTFLKNNKLEYIPFIFAENNEPIEFDITFIHDYLKFRFILKFEIGTFNSSSNRKILLEELYIDNKEIYSREENIVNVYIDHINEKYLNDGFTIDNYYNNLKMINKNIQNTKLFLSTDFPSFISKAISEKTIEWFDEKLCVFNNFKDINFYMESEKSLIEELPVDIYEATKRIGVIGSEMFFKKKDKDQNPELYSVLNINGKNISMPSELIESCGTLHFIDLYPAIIDSLLRGTTLVIDELDSSLHPHIIMNIINIYHDSDINMNNAQLIFNTHNPFYINNKIFRRDEIFFVEKDRDTKISDLYKLSDFKTNSDVDTRNTTDYCSNYFKNKYGAIEYVDLSEEVIKIIKRGNKCEEKVRE